MREEGKEKERARREGGRGGRKTQFNPSGKDYNINKEFPLHFLKSGTEALGFQRTAIYLLFLD